MDNYNINYCDTKQYIGDDCIDNVIKELLRSEKSKEMQNSTYTILFIKINPNTSIETINERLWILSTMEGGHNTSFIVKHDDNFSILTTEVFAIGIK
ncbi:MAG: hypothetical protein L3J19_00110 [Sulfurimonas sp.]|nr:hypothetical protein [Sulfurimonas sp.]